ncbi:hypothetical protein MBLNU230_g0230t1 [Neophaeotheca triangularis]
MADTEAELNELFAPPGKPLQQDILNELQSILRLHTLSAQELFYKWESYVIKMGVESTRMDYKTARDFKKDLQDTLDRESRAKGQHNTNSRASRAAATPRAGAGGDVFGMLDGLVGGTPSTARVSSAKRKGAGLETPSAKAPRSGLNSSPADFKTPAATREVQGVAFENRSNAGQTIETLNDHLPAAIAPSEIPGEARVKLKANSDMEKFRYKPMAMKLSEASEILDDRIDSFTELVQEHYKFDDNAFGNPAAQSAAEVVVVGRIACDQPNGKLNAASLVLETSRRMGAGMRVPLRLEGVSYDFFPGRIVALRGSNVSGEYFAVTEVLPIPLLGYADSTPSDLDIHNDRLTSADGEARPLHIVTASGPYTTDTDLSFTPLYTLLNRAEEERADVLILSGPFLDLEHPAIASGDFEDYLPSDTKLNPDRATLNDVFRVLISQPLDRLLQAVPTLTVILVPSIRDAVSKHVSYPQDGFRKKPLGLPGAVRVVTNPITLSINELLVSISTQDVLSELRRENVHQAVKGQKMSDDMLHRLSSGVIEQRHFFPVYPPQARENLPKPTAIDGEVADVGGEERLAVGASLDLAYLKLGEMLNVRPDVLVLPSALTPFAKVVDSVLCINPGTLSKKRGAGTFASMNIQPRALTDQEREAGEAVTHNVYERARVDVVRT